MQRRRKEVIENDQLHSNKHEWLKDSDTYITTVQNVISQVILPNALLVRDIPTPHILLFIFQFTFEVKQITGPFEGSLLNSTVNLNDCDGQVGS